MEEVKVKVTIEPAKRSWREIFLQILEWGTKAVEFMAGIQLLLFGIWLLLSYQTFSIVTYRYMKMTASENSWGTAFVLAGLFQIIGLFLQDNSYGLNWRRTACFVASILFNVVGFSYSLYSFYTLGVPYFGSMAIFEILIFWKLMSKRANYA